MFMKLLEFLISSIDWLIKHWWVILIILALYIIIRIIFTDPSKEDQDLEESETKETTIEE